jgi:7-carboxy-7-deazaguanine synthase (Cx14CxxC type)
MVLASRCFALVNFVQGAFMPYRVKEIFYTLQGEGRNTGRAAVFCRFSGCNLWSGREEDRAAARCRFCDTDFVGTDGPGGGVFPDAEELAAAAVSNWRGGSNPAARPFIVCTGGEPLLQLDEHLVAALHRADFEIAIETNGTRIPPPGIDWICVSPKAGEELLLRSGDELKLVFPQVGAEPERYADLAFRNFYLQPMDGPDASRNARLAVEYCLAHPQWRMSLQTHKLLGIP